MPCKPMPKITKDTTLSLILEKKSAEKVLVKYNLPCLACPYAKMEMDELKIGDVCKMYGIDCRALLKELNELK